MEWLLPYKIHWHAFLAKLTFCLKNTMRSLTRKPTLRQKTPSCVPTTTSCRDVDQLQSDNDYLKMARTIVPDTAGLADSKAIISKLVRDIDKCISQLNG